MSIRTCLALVIALAISSLLSLTIAQGAGGGGSSPGGTISVNGTPPPELILGPVAVPYNFTISNGGPTEVQLYVVDPGADPLPEGWKLSDPLPEGWDTAGKLKNGESTSVGAFNGQKIKGLSTRTGASVHSDLTWG